MASQLGSRLTGPWGILWERGRENGIYFPWSFCLLGAPGRFDMENDGDAVLVFKARCEQGMCGLAGPSIFFSAQGTCGMIWDRNTRAGMSRA